MKATRGEEKKFSAKQNSNLSSVCSVSIRQSALLYMVKDQVEFSVERLFHLTAQVGHPSRSPKVLHL